MLTLVFDTETTGLPPKKKKGVEHTLQAMPYIIQLAAILYDNQRPVGHLSCMVSPKTELGTGIIPGEKFWIENKMTLADIEHCMFDSTLALKMFAQYCRFADRVVAHNTRFDADRIDQAFLRADGGSPAWQAAPKFCTKESLTDVLCIPNKWGSGNKWPTLDEAYRRLVDPNGFEDAHDAMADVQACAKVLFAMEEQGIPLLPAGK